MWFGKSPSRRKKIKFWVVWMKVDVQIEWIWWSGQGTTLSSVVRAVCQQSWPTIVCFCRIAFQGKTRLMLLPRQVYENDSRLDVNLRFVSVRGDMIVERMALRIATRVCWRVMFWWSQDLREGKVFEVSISISISWINGLEIH